MKRCCVVLSVLLATAAACGGELRRMTYNNPAARPYLKVGLWAWPMAMDYDGDGVLDLVVACGDVPYGGTHFFRNPGGGPLPVFAKGVRVAEGGNNIARGTSVGNGRDDVLTPGCRLVDFPKNGFAQKKMFQGLNANVHPCTVRGNVWRQVDFDGDGRLDLLIGVDDWHLVSSALWGNPKAENFAKDGKWLGPIPEGYVYFARNLREWENGTDYAEPVRLTLKGGALLQTEGNPMPMCEDWDGDGDLDLICGDFVDGFHYFANGGTRQAPVYEPARDVMASTGGRLAMDLAMITPSAVDWDGDGRLDIICGDEDGRVAFIRNAGRTEGGVPVFDPPVYFRQEANELNFGCLSTPCGCDWDGDGDWDIIAGCSAGYVAFIENLSGPGVREPKWAEPVRLKADGAEIRIMAGEKGSVQGPFERKWGYTCLSVADWDGDGLPDLMVNSIWGDVVWYRNVGTRQKPALAAAADVEVAWEGAQPEMGFGWYQPSCKRNPRGLLTQWRTTPMMYDWNGDGLMDLVMLDKEGYLALYERVRRDGKLLLLPPKRIFANEDGSLLRLNARVQGHSGRTKFTLADWNGDGRCDLILNSKNAAVRLNLGERDGRTVFGPPTNVSDRKLSNHTTSPTTVDFDGDGRPELLVGAEDGYFYYLLGGGAEKTVAPDGEKDMTKRIVEAVREVSAAGGGTVKLAKGTYHLYSASAEKLRFHVSNHDQPEVRPIFLPLVGVRNVTIASEGARLVMHGMGTALLLQKTEDVTVRGVTIEWAKPYFAHGTVVGFDGSKTLLRFPARDEVFVRDGGLFLRGEDWETKLVTGMLFDGRTHEIVERTADIACRGSAGACGNGMFWIERDLAKLGAKVGDVFVMRNTWRPHPVVSLDRAKDTVFENFTYRGGFGMGLVAQLSENVRLSGGGSYPAERTDYSSCILDATHFSNCRGQVVVENCLFEGMMDDALNVHSTCLGVVGRPAQDKIRCRYMHPQAIGFGVFAPGDAIRFIRGKTLENGWIGRVKAVETHDEREISITLETPIADGYGVGDAVENADFQCAVTFRHNVVRNNRARGVLFTTPKKIVCEDNFFDHVSGSAILLAGDAQGWYESGACEDLTIRRNRFRDCLTSVFQYCDALISIHPEVKEPANQRRRYHRNIRIEDNEIETFDVPLLYALSAENVTWRNNVVIRNANYRGWGKGSFVTRFSDKVIVDGKERKE